MAHGSPDYTVVVPTCSRRASLERVVRSLETQTRTPSFELVVVNDGSTDDTAEWLNGHRFRVPTRVVHQGNQGPAAARNAGIREARGLYVAFVDDDTVPAASWLAEHRACHRRHDDAARVAVIGYTPWHFGLHVTRFMRFIGEEGPQFGFARIVEPEDVPFNFFYSSNLSLRREALLAEPFDGRFPYAAWEDIEVGYRLKKNRGMRLVYEPRAIAYHDRATSVAAFGQRQERAGYAAVVFHQRHPELGRFLGIGESGPPRSPFDSPLLRRRRELVARALELWPIGLRTTWERFLRSCYLQGLHRGWRERVGSSAPRIERAS